MRIVLLDATLFGALVVIGALGAERLSHYVEVELGLSGVLTRALLALGAVIVCVPVLLGVLRGARALGAALANIALPAIQVGRPDAAAAPRRALILGIQLGVLLCVVLVLLAVTSPFLPRIATPIMLVSSLIVLGWFVWRAADDLQGHVRASAEVFAEALQLDAKSHSDANVQRARDLLPGMGVVESVHLDAGSRFAGSTLAEVDLRGLTGASVVAIARGETRIPMPKGADKILAGDVLALFGPSAGVAAAVALLREPAATGAAPPQTAPQAGAQSGGPPPGPVGPRAT